MWKKHAHNIQPLWATVYIWIVSISSLPWQCPRLRIALCVFTQAVFPLFNATWRSLNGFSINFHSLGVNEAFFRFTFFSGSLYSFSYMRCHIKEDELYVMCFLFQNDCIYYPTNVLKLEMSLKKRNIGPCSHFPLFLFNDAWNVNNYLCIKWK